MMETQDRQPIHVSWSTARHKVDPLDAYNEFRRIKEKHGHIDADNVILESRAKKAVLHAEFEWDDTAAADEHRRYQARTLFSHLHVVYREAPERRSVRGFQVVTQEKRGKKKADASRYVETREALEDPAMRAEILARALKEAAAWRRRYADLSELSVIFQAIDEKISNAA